MNKPSKSERKQETRTDRSDARSLEPHVRNNVKSKRECVSLTGGVERVVPGYDSDPGSSLSQAADLVVLDAAVHRCDAKAAGGVEHFWLLQAIERENIKNPLIRAVV